MRRILKCCALAAASVIAIDASFGLAATTYDVQLDQSLFGHANQNNVPARGPGVPGSMSCAPTAVANSFQ